MQITGALVGLISRKSSRPHAPIVRICTSMRRNESHETTFSRAPILSPSPHLYVPVETLMNQQIMSHTDICTNVCTRLP